jgi:hypothetical protein
LGSQLGDRLGDKETEIKTKAQVTDDGEMNEGKAADVLERKQTSS